MPYGKTDELAINTIRTLAVCTVLPRPSLPRNLAAFVSVSAICPAIAGRPQHHSGNLQTFTSHDPRRVVTLFPISIADFELPTGRCHGSGQLWPSWRPYGHGPGGPRSIQQVHDFQPKEPRLG